MGYRSGSIAISRDMGPLKGSAMAGEFLWHLTGIPRKPCERLGRSGLSPRISVAHLCRRGVTRVATLSLLSLIIFCYAKEKLQNYQGFSVPAECIKTLEKQEKTPILARKFLAQSQLGNLNTPGRTGNRFPGVFLYGNSIAPR